MTTKDHVDTAGNVRPKFTACPKCNRALDTPLDDGGHGTEFTDHWPHRSANPAVAVDGDAVEEDQP